MQSCASRLQWSEYQKLCGGKAYKCIGLTDWFLVWDESLQNVENVFRIFKMLRSCRSFKMLQRCELSMLQMLHAILLKPKNVATILQGSFLEKVCNLAEFNNNKNFFLECCRAYRCCRFFIEQKNSTTNTVLQNYYSFKFRQFYELTDFLFSCSTVVGNPPLRNIESQYKFILHLGAFCEIFIW